VTAGDIVEVVGWVRNDGQEDAHFISIRCLADGHLFDVAIIDLVSPGQLRRAVCDWPVPADDNAVMLTVVVDYSLEIRESNEDNNEASVSVAVTTVESNGQSAESTASGMTNEVKIGATAAAIMAVIAVFFMFAPKGIKKIE
jgi:subtilase family serine protease